MFCLLLCAACSLGVTDDPQVDAALAAAAGNRGELEKALQECPAAERAGMAFLVVNMPEADRKTLPAEFLLENARLAYRARAEVPWGKAIPEDIFLNDVLPYAHLDEKREPWRQEFFELCMPMVKECKTPAEAAQKLNTEIFARLKVKYSTKRRAPNQNARESIASGLASCTGLSIVLADACRAVCVPARLAGTPMWSNHRGNHTWVEVWDRQWHFTGACEQDPQGLDRGWFVGDAARAEKNSFEHAIYAASFRRGNVHFPLVWAPQNRTVPAENVTDRYAKPSAAPAADTVQILVRVVAADGRRMAEKVTFAPSGAVAAEGISRGESADANDILAFPLKRGSEAVISVAGVERKVLASAAGEQLVEIVLPDK